MSNFSDNFSDDSSSPPVAPRNVDSKEFSFDIPIQIEASSKEEAEQLKDEYQNKLEQELQEMTTEEFSEKYGIPIHELTKAINNDSEDIEEIEDFDGSDGSIDINLNADIRSKQTSIVYRMPTLNLKIYVVPQETEEKTQQLKEMYMEKIRKHLEVLEKGDSVGGFYDAGFDIFCPTTQQCKVGKVAKYHLGIKCSSFVSDPSDKFSNVDESMNFPVGYFLMPRSSISKTSLRLANSVGVIDSGYRGELIAMFDCFYGDYKIEEGSRLMQVVAPSMMPIYPILVDTEEELGTTDRGEGGFGSTGK